jgi:hypothetical protein
MNRRSFLGSLVGGLAATAAVRTWPFRVYSFPTNILVPRSPTLDDLITTTLADLREDILYDNFFIDTPWLTKLRSPKYIDNYLSSVTVTDG